MRVPKGDTSIRVVLKPNEKRYVINGHLEEIKDY